MKITHDLHTHTLMSSCSFDPHATMQAYVDKASELGHTVIGISNHLWDEKVPGASEWYAGQCVSYGFEEKYAIPADTHGVRVLFGAETEYCGMTKTLGMSAETGARFDYILVPHTHSHMKNFVMEENDDVKAYRNDFCAKLEKAFPELGHALACKMTNAMSYNEVRARLAAPKVDEVKYHVEFCFSSFETLMAHAEFRKLTAAVKTFIAHPFWPCGLSGDEVYTALNLILAEEDRLFNDFKACAALGVGLDVNMDCYHFDVCDLNDNPMVKIMRVAKRAGCKFIFGTDGHAVADLEDIRRGEAVADAIGICEDNLDDIVK